MKRLLLLPAIVLQSLALTVLAPAHAADRWYQVEVLVFSHLNADLSAEQWPANDGIRVSVDGAIPAPNTITTPLMGGTAAPSAQELLRLAAVPAAHYKLLDTFKTLSRSRNYRPLLHTAWRQPVGTGKNNFKVRLAGGKDYASRYGANGKLLTTGDEPTPAGLWELDGFVRLSAAKFLHAEMEMLFRRASISTTGISTTGVTEPGVAAAATAVAGSEVTTAANNLNWQTGDSSETAEDMLQFFKFSQSRRVKSNEIHYFDHPLFGVIIQLRPLEPERESDVSSE